MNRLLALKWRLLPLVLAFGVLLAPIAINYWNKHQTLLVAQSAEQKLKTAEPVRISGIPNRILVPRLSIDLPVVSQSYSAALMTWPVAPSVGNYAVESAPANNFKGEALIYGHNNRSVFGPLLGLKSGDIVYIYTDNGHILKYSYLGSQDVTPRKTDIFKNTAKAPAGLKMLTCDGPNFEYRHLMSFELIKAS